MHDTTDRKAPIEAPLQRIRASIRRQALRESIGPAVCAAAALLVGLFIVDMAVTQVLGPWVWLAAGLVALGASWTFVRARTRAFAANEAIAARIEAIDESYRNDVRAALEFSGEAATGDETRDALRERLIARVGARLGGDARLEEAVVPRGGHTVFVTSAVGLALLLFVFMLGAPEQAAHSWRALNGDASQVATSEGVRAIQRPIVSTLALTVSPPGYSRLEPHSIQSSTGDIEVLAGSEIRLEGRALQDVQRVTLVLDRGDGVQRRELSVDDQRVFRGVLMAERSGSYHFEVTTTDEEVIRDPIDRKLVVRPDEAPSVRIRQPVENVEVEPGDIVDFEYVVTDDFGISEANFQWYFRGDPDDVRELPLLGEVDGLRKTDEAAFDTAPMLLQPGDELVVLIEAFDNNSLTGPSRGVSRPISLSVASPDQRNEEILAAKEQLFEELLKQLGAMLAAPMNDYAWDEEREQMIPTARAGTPEELAALVGPVVEAMSGWPTTLDRLRALSEAMAEDTLTSPRELAMIEGSYTRLYQQERDVRQQLAALEADASERRVAATGFAPVAMTYAELIDQTERITLVLEELIANQKADAVARALEELTATRDRLRELLEEYKNTEDPYLREQIEREMKRLGQRMRDLLARLSEQVDNLPWEHVNREAMDPSEAQQNVSDMGSSMEQMQKMLDEGNIDGALQALEQLSQSLDTLTRELGNPLSSGDPGTLSEFDRQMGEIMDQISDLEAKEQQLERDTTELEEAWRKERQRQIQDRLDRTLREARERIEAARETMDAVDRQRMMDRTREQMAEADDALRRLSERLAHEDIAGAEEAAMRAVSELNDANRAVEFMERYLQGNPQTEDELAKAVRATREGGDAAREVGQAMRELMELAEPQPGEQGRRDMEEFAQRQQQIGGQLDRLGERLQQMGQQFPMMQEQFDEPMKQTGEGMQQAESSLRRSQMRPAKEGQQQALQGLRSLRQQMQQSMAQRRQQQQQRGRHGGGPLDEDRVEIPDEAERGNRYREEVVDAMREGSLEAYDAEIRRYYESLVQ